MHTGDAEAHLEAPLAGSLRVARVKVALVIYSLEPHWFVLQKKVFVRLGEVLGDLVHFASAAFLFNCMRTALHNYSVLNVIMADSLLRNCGLQLLGCLWPMTEVLEALLFFVMAAEEEAVVLIVLDFGQTLVVVGPWLAGALGCMREFVLFSSWGFSLLRLLLVSVK